MTCPVCQFSGDAAASAGGVSVCAGCGASVVLVMGSDEKTDALDTLTDAPQGIWQRATALHTTRLSADDLATLRKARGLARRKT